MIKLNNKLVHILPTAGVSGELMFVIDLIKDLSEYNHYIIFEKFDTKIDFDIIWLLQSVGANVLFVDYLTPEILAKEQPSGAIIYNLEGHSGIGAACPSIYYSFGTYDPLIKCDMVISASEYACEHDCKGNKLNLDKEYVIPPAINTRVLRYYNKQDDNFIVGLITSGTRNKYPCSFVIDLLSKLKDTPLALTILDNYKHPGIQLAISEYAKTRKLITCPLKITAGLYYIAHCDVLIYATADNYFEPYSRTVTEAMAFGRPVICENRGCFPTLFEHNNNMLMFNMVDEAIEHINKLKKDKTMRSMLGLNAQLRSSWEDISIHSGKIKKVLRMIGV